jgi:hypothetical protein
LGDIVSTDRTSVRFGLAIVLAVAVHAIALWGLASSIAFRFDTPDERKSEPKVVALAPRIVPPPPNVTKLGPTDVIVTMQPRFRPRMPAVAPQRRYGDPALAIWSYLCNRDFSLSQATEVSCPPPGFGNVDLGVLDPLNRTGDVGALMGPDTATMSLDEAGVARGWVKMPPAKGQTGLAGKTDKSHADPTERFGPMPWDEGGSKGTSYSWSKGRTEVVPDHQ